MKIFEWSMVHPAPSQCEMGVIDKSLRRSHFSRAFFLWGSRFIIFPGSHIMRRSNDGPEHPSKRQRTGDTPFLLLKVMMFNSSPPTCCFPGQGSNVRPTVFCYQVNRLTSISSLIDGISSCIKDEFTKLTVMRGCAEAGG